MEVAFLPYTIACTALHLLVDVFFTGDQQRKKEQVEANVNRVVSAVHAIVMFYLSVLYWQTIPSSFWLMINININTHLVPEQSLAIHCMIGYLLYDTVVELRVGKGWQILAHHVVGFVSHFLTLHYDNGAAATYSMMVYLAELSTPFLNTSYLLKEYKHTKNVLYSLSGALLLVSFFFVRVLLSPYLLYHMVSFWPTNDRSVIFWLNIGAVAFFIGINYFWFYQLLRIVFKKGKGKGKGSKKKE